MNYHVRHLKPEVRNYFRTHPTKQFAMKTFIEAAKNRNTKIDAPINTEKCGTSIVKATKL